MREASEESGIGGLVLLPGPVDVDVHRFVAPPEPVHLHLDVRWLALAPPDARPVANAESLELRWFTLDELAAFEEPGMRRLAAAARTLSV